MSGFKQKKDMERVVRRCHEMYGRINVLVNNEYILVDTEVLEMKEAD